MEKGKITPAVIIWQNTLKEVPLWDLDSNNEDEGSLEYYENQLKKKIGYKLGNDHRFFKICLMGMHFSFRVNFHPFINPKKDYHWTISVWDNTGSNSVCEYRIESEDKETDMMPNDIWNKVISDCEDFVRGIQKCNGCGKKIKKEEIAGQYFAGRYCSHCWETKYKAIEARETYE